MLLSKPQESSCPNLGVVGPKHNDMNALVLNNSMFGQLDPYPRDPSIHIVSTLGPEVYKYYPYWAIWIPRVRADAAPSFMRPTRFQNQSLCLGFVV